jgi:signal transduction histidine kinase/CheY-like chemotaxis protein
MFKLLRHFSVMSALATAAITSILVLGFGWYENRNLHQLAEDRNIAQAYGFANAMLDRFTRHVGHPVGTPGDVLRAQPETKLLDTELRQMTRNLPVLKVKVYNPGGLTIYSSDHAQIGESKAGDRGFRSSVREKKAFTTSGRRAVLNSFGENFTGRSVAETYVPILNDTGDVWVVLELYTDISAYVAEVDREIWTMVMLLVGALGALYVLLYLVVKRADGILIGQYQELATFNARLEAKVEERTKRLLNQQSLMSWVTKSEEFRQGDINAAFGNLTRITAAALGVERASIWMFNAEHDTLSCADLFCAIGSEHSSGNSISVAEYPAYFSALQTEQYIAADDALTDCRLKFFADSYLRPLGIGSVLDVPIVHGGRVQGVLCLEHIGSPITWTAEQRLFSTAIANFASLALERQERAKAEEELRDANRSVEAANKAKSLFLANMSHEIRTPMNGVFGMTDLLMRTELSERQQKFVGIISASAKRLLTIINDILDLSRIESGKLDLDTHEFSVRSCVEETIDLLAGEAQTKGIELSVFISSDVPASVLGDSGRLRQVITNIASNAIKFTSAGEVAVRLGCGGIEGDKAELFFEVRDTGIGIPEDVQRRLFTPFQQADTSIARRFGGTGLGLSISRHLVELMGGQMALTSAPGVGTTMSFSITLPIKDVGECPVAKDIVVLAERRILIVDDRDTNREVLSSYLVEGGATPVCAASAAEGYALMCAATEQGMPFELALVDMIMPGANGLEFAHMVRGNSKLPELKLVMLTSMSWKGDTRLARELGFGAFLTKPVHREELLRTVNRILSSRGGQSVPAECGDMNVVARTKFGLNVLVAEDNPVNVEVAREYLSGLGCTVTIAENGLAAVEAVKACEFDVVLMDCQMPEMDGLTATRHIRQLEADRGRRRVAIIAVTANAYAEDRTTCMEAGMDDYVSKPFSEEQLRHLIARWSPAATAVPLAANGVVGVADAGTAAAAKAAAAAPIAVPPPAAPVSTEGALDMEMLRRMQKTHPSLVGRLIDTYLNYAPKAIQQLVVALETEDHGQLKITAHSLKSSSANIGAMALSGLCREVEHRLKTSEVWDGEVNLNAVVEIEASFQAVHAALIALKDELKAAAPVAVKAIA